MCYLCVLQIVEEDVEGYVSVVEGLEEEAKRLVRADHFDSVNITARQVAIYIYIYIYYVAMVTAGLYIAYTPYQYST